MKQRLRIFQSWAIEEVTVLLASTILFPVSDALKVQLSILPFVMVDGTLLSNTTSAGMPQLNSLYKHST